MADENVAGADHRSLLLGYGEMAADVEREVEALAWSEALIADSDQHEDGDVFCPLDESARKADSLPS